MTEPTNRWMPNVEEELDSILEGIAYRVRVKDLPEARGRLRRALMYAWSDGHAVGVMSQFEHGEPAQNPWAKSDNEA